MISPLRFRACWLGVITLGACALGCGSTDQARSEREPAADDASFGSIINACPSFAFSLVSPQSIRANEKAIVTVFATDLDSDDTLLSYAWSASAGDFTEPDSFLTEYACADAGPQRLRVVASDADGCESALDLDVTCEGH